MSAPDPALVPWLRSLAGAGVTIAVALLLRAAGVGTLGIVLASLAVATLAALALWQLASADARALDAEATLVDLRAELATARAAQDSLASDLALLGSYGTLLIDSTDLAEALQISEQMLSRLLPGCAGSIYPLIDGEGLSEVTHLWGTHAGETRPQATWNDCRALGINKAYATHSGDASSLCAHVLPPADGQAFSTACIPLEVQNDSLGWLYLSAPGYAGVPKLPVAIAAAEQLSQALANLRLRESLRDLSVRDPLTGLFNRRYLAESLGREMARSKRRGLPLTVMMMDLDHFKAFNDNYGHSAGDAVLVAFARLLHNNFRSEDIACRLGGEEFVMIMPEMDRAVAARRAEEMLRSTLAIQLVHEGRELPPITVSIGLAMFPEHGEQPEEMMRLADQAVYRAKSQGRNQVCFPPEP
jgi:diguanylate cyclase (GGDEF)-like protein